MHFVSGDARTFPDDLYARVARYRHRIFVERLGWHLRTENGMEVDQFDRPDTVYVAAQDDQGLIHGCARLLPTTSPYLLAEVFPQLLNGLTPPNSPETWELSRFAAVDFGSQKTSSLGQFCSPITVSLLQEAAACAAERGAKRLITVSPVGVERLVRRAGFEVQRMGPPMLVDGHSLFACLIPLRPRESQCLPLNRMAATSRSCRRVLSVRQSMVAAHAGAYLEREV